jgi:hypothetical protein
VYADLAATLDNMKVKVQALEQRADPLYADVEGLITVKCLEVDAKIQATADNVERVYRLANERLHKSEERLTEITMRLTTSR